MSGLVARLEPATPLAAVMRVWEAAVGETIAAECRPVSVRGGVVTVRCSSATWAHELTLLEPTLLAPLNAALAGVRIGDLREVTLRALRFRAA